MTHARGGEAPSRYVSLRYVRRELRGTGDETSLERARTEVASRVGPGSSPGSLMSDIRIRRESGHDAGEPRPQFVRPAPGVRCRCARGVRLESDGETRDEKLEQRQ